MTKLSSLTLVFTEAASACTMSLAETQHKFHVEIHSHTTGETHLEVDIFGGELYSSPSVGLAILFSQWEPSSSVHQKEEYILVQKYILIFL